MGHDELMQRIDKLNEIGVALSVEKDKTRLLERILIAAMELTGADGGTLYSVQPDNMLRFEIVRNETLKLYWKRGEPSHFFPTDDLPLFKENAQPNDQMVVVYAVVHDRTINIEDAYVDTVFDFSGTRKFDQKTGYRCQSMLTVPMKNHEHEIIGVLQLINAKEDQKIIPFSATDLHLVESLASQAAIAMTNQALIQSLKDLFESFIKVLADAIDEKSPVTGRHCKRVPIIAMLLAKAVNETTTGKFQETKFSADELYELEIASLLHDCGKVVTPVNVVEKSTKLEGIWDRLELIDVRLDLIEKQAEEKAAGEKLQVMLHAFPNRSDALKTPFETIDAALTQQLSKVQEARQFLHECNQGREEMPAEWQKRLQELAKWTWEKEGSPAPLLSEDELHKLTVAHGTLTYEERQVIQNHVVMTRKMLNNIPYPKNLKQIPEIAGSHHERMDGKGYPQGLTRFQMSLRARILGIADIFEALTAPDRPYKHPLPLSQALAVMQSLKDEGHIDPDLWDLFVQKKVYLHYGKQYLSTDQLDVP